MLHGNTKPSMEHERPQQMIDFDEDLVGDVSMRPNDALLTSYGRHTRIPGERSRKQPARARTRNSLLFITPSVDLLKGSRPTTNLHGVRQRCTRILGTPEPRCTSLQRGMPLTCQINILFNRKWSSHVPTFQTAQKRRRDRSSTYLGIVLIRLVGEGGSSGG